MRYQKIESKIWNDEKFSRLTPLQQRLFFYVLTSPHGNLLGIYVLKEGYVCEDLKCSAKDFRKDFHKLIEVGLLDYDASVCLVFIKNFLKHNPITNPNQVIAAEKTIKELPRSHLLLMIKGLVKGLNEGLLEGLGKVVSNSEEEEEEEEEKSSRSSASAPDFISQLKEIYAWVDVDTEIQKMKGFLLLPKNKGRKLTHAFAVRWLNRVDKPLEDKKPAKPKGPKPKYQCDICGELHEVGTECQKALTGESS